MGQLLVRNDNDFYVRGFRDTRTEDEYLNAAVGTWELLTAPSDDPSSTEVASGDMTYVADSNGDYVGTMDASVSLVAGTEYYLHVVLSQSGIDGDWEISVKAALRSGSSPTS